MKVAWAEFALILILVAVNSEVLRTEQRHIVLCLKNVITNNFTPDRPVYITFPSLNEAYAPKVVRRQLAFKPPRSVIDSLAETLNDDMKWQLVLFQTNYNFQYKISNYSLPSSYPPAVQCISFIWGRKGDESGYFSFEEQITMLFNNRPSKDIQVVTVVLNGIRKSAILKLLSLQVALYGLTDSIFLFPERKRRNVDAHIDVYTWFPYRFPEICGSYNHPVVIDTWMEDALGRFQNNATLFPNKVPKKDFGGCPIILTQLESFETTMTKVERYILHQVFSLLNVIPVDGNTLEISIADIKYGPLYLDIPTLDIVFRGHSFPTPHIQTKLRWFVPCPKSNPRQGKFYEVFTLPVWFIMSLSFLLAALTEWCIQWTGLVSHDTSSGFCNLWAAFLSVAVIKVPNDTCLRFFFLSWLIYSFAVSTIFQAFFTTYLVDPGKTQEINTLEEFKRSRLDHFVERGSFGSWCMYGDYIQFCNSLTFRTLTSALEFKNKFECESDTWDAIQMGFVVSAWLRNSSILANDIQAEMFKVLMPQGYKLCSVRDLTVPSTIVLFISTYSVYFKPVDDLLRRLRDTGLLGRFKNDFLFNMRGGKYLEEMKKYFKIEASSESDYFIFTLSHMKLSFCLLVMGYTLAVVVFLGEICYSKLYV